MQGPYGFMLTDLYLLPLLSGMRVDRAHAPPQQRLLPRNQPIQLDGHSALLLAQRLTALCASLLRSTGADGAVARPEKTLGFI